MESNMTKTVKVTHIGNIENAYGGLTLKKEKDRYFWGIEGIGITGFKEISKEGYDLLMAGIEIKPSNALSCAENNKLNLEHK